MAKEACDAKAQSGHLRRWRMCICRSLHCRVQFSARGTAAVCRRTVLQTCHDDYAWGGPRAMVVIVHDFHRAAETHTRNCGPPKGAVFPQSVQGARPLCGVALAAHMPWLDRRLTVWPLGPLQQPGEIPSLPSIHNHSDLFRFNAF